MARQTVQVHGLKELQQRLTALSNEFGSNRGKAAVRAALRKAARIVQDDAKRFVPVKTGLVRDNIIVATARAKTLPPGRTAVNVTVRSKARPYADTAKNRRLGRVGKTWRDSGALYYARFLEFGTSKMSRRPFLTPAFERNKMRLPAVIRDELAIAIDRAVARLRK